MRIISSRQHLPKSITPALIALLVSMILLSGMFAPVFAVTLNEALDNNTLTFTTGGSAAWFGQTSVYSYGGSSAQSGDISDGQTSWLSFNTPYIGPSGAYLRFDWKVSSEERYDLLSFYMDYELMDSIDGEVGWQTMTYYLPASGYYSLEWEYVKDGSVSSGSDAGWVDHVQLITAWSAPMIGEAVDNTALTWSSFFSGYGEAWAGEPYISMYGGDAAQSGSVRDSSYSYLDTGVTGPGTLYFYWKVSSESGDYLIFYIDGVSQTSVSGDVDWNQESFSISSGYHTLRWSYKKDVGVSAGSDAGWLDQLEFVPTSVTLGEAVDNTGLTWSSGGSAHWFGQTATSYYGGDASQSGVVIDDAYTWMQTTVAGPGTLSFYWKVSSESGYDFLEFYIDGVLQTEISGEVSWQQKSFSLASGSHTIAWSYSKDRSVSAGSDAGWVDRVQFTSTPAGTVTVTTPNGGQNWVRGTTHTITWTSTGSPGANVKIELLKGGVLNTVISSSTANDGSYSWTISPTQTTGTNYRIRITSTSNAAITDTSNSDFTISLGTLTVTSPNGGQSWVRGTTHTITWSSVGSPGTNVKIELMKSGVLNKIISSSTANDGSYSWTISSTQTLGTDYKVRITSTSITSITDSSNGNFAITVGALTVTTPNGGNRWVRGTTHGIAWSSIGSPGTYVKIELLKGGVLNKVISSSTANDGYYSWTVSSTQTLGTDYKIRITSTSVTSISDSSNSNFAITAGALTVTTPNGGQTWARGSVHTITWASTGSPGAYVKIELLKGGVLNKIISSSTANDGSYTWTISATQTVGTDYKIRITSTSITSITDNSNSNFAIN